MTSTNLAYIALNIYPIPFEPDAAPKKYLSQDVIFAAFSLWIRVKIEKPAYLYDLILPENVSKFIIIPT